ncbi:ATP-grasp domain-containing protein [Pseudomonas citrulli]|uniref:ATP-grasp domain-containing protein n=1 Tax=Pseudomonas citrulli TaxID=3064347 RepID=A0ABT9C4D5_9PSED|nr:ATP-grasp domain-containing protein [Pseudomonas sp. K18]MDO7899050.1 ATP-grasp domain-containing protein [Pseudomonas sp. K18]
MKYAVIVDAYSTGASLADELKRYGITCIHVQTSAEILEYDVDSYRPGDFQQRFVATQDLEALTDALAEFEPAFIIPGCESGVELADRLSELMGTPGNGTALSACRRDKWHMAKRLHQLGIPAARVALIHQMGEVETAIETIDGWPVVIKPVNSAGADGIHFCYETTQVRHAVDKELGRLNEMGLINDTLLAMEYLAGQQYLVQAVSRAGEHFVFEIWRDNRKPVPGAGVVNDREVLIDLLSEEAAPIIAYVHQCLDAFGVDIGPSFLEVMVTANGPMLIEWAARMMGTQELSAMTRVRGVNAVNLCVACYADPEAFHSMLDKVNRSNATCEVIGMINSVSGQVTHRRWLEELSARPSFFKMIRAPEIGDRVAPTIGISTNYGFIYLVHEDPAVTYADYLWIRAKEAEDTGFFDVQLSQAAVAQAC